MNERCAEEESKAAAFPVTKLELFAGQAMVGLLAANTGRMNLLVEDVTRHAFDLAEAMIAQSTERAVNARLDRSCESLRWKRAFVQLYAEIVACEKEAQEFLKQVPMDDIRRGQRNCFVSVKLSMEGLFRSVGVTPQEAAMPE